MRINWKNLGLFLLLLMLSILLPLAVSSHVNPVILLALIFAAVVASFAYGWQLGRRHHG